MSHPSRPTARVPTAGSPATLASIAQSPFTPSRNSEITVSCPASAAASEHQIDDHKGDQLRLVCGFQGLLGFFTHGYLGMARSSCDSQGQYADHGGRWL